MHAFPCGTLALDFVGTLRARRDAEPREMFDAPASVDAWFVEAGVITSGPDAVQPDLVDAVELREAIYTAVASLLEGDALPAASVRTLNRWAATPPVPLALENGAVRRQGSTSAGLAAVARNAVELLGGDEAALLRECGRPGCTQVYVDRSRGGRREWCSMRTCGNRVKASQFRARHRGATEGSAV